MIISSQGEACSPNDDIKALDLNGTNGLRDRLLEIQASTGGGEAALLAGAEIELEQEKQAEKAEQEKLAKIEEARQALQDFRDFLVQSTYKGAQALPIEEELLYSYNPETQEYEITRKDGQDIVLNLNGKNLQGELPLPPQLMVTRLICYNNQLTTLPELPASLTELICSGNQLTTLPELPTSLTELICHSNQLTTLPELPNSLSQLDCYTNQLTTLPELPASLTNLNCGSNQLTTLPKLPPSLTRLDCYTNQLTTLPELPASLTMLQCSSNQLTTLPELPNSLSQLECEYNPSLSNDPATRNALKAMRLRGGRVLAW
jgi:hypothetical protein